VSADGKTVEILNTDAEGRLILADAITHALRNGATHVIDLATLTGAATISIGHGATAGVSNDDGFWQLVEAAARKAATESGGCPSSRITACCCAARSPISGIPSTARLGPYWEACS
jgi:leucyl aminopeptidase